MVALCPRVPSCLRGVHRCAAHAPLPLRSPVASKCGIVESVLSVASMKASKDLKKTDGSKRQRLTGIAKLDDANDAGGRHSEDCTLILTEGDSAKALAVRGAGRVGWERGRDRGRAGVGGEVEGRQEWTFLLRTFISPTQTGHHEAHRTLHLACTKSSHLPCIAALVSYHVVGGWLAGWQVSGLAVVGRDRYGVFPLRGKLLNVRDATHKQIMDNAEISSIKQIMGLQQGKQYDSTKSLRYGHLMIMTDQVRGGRGGVW